MDNQQLLENISILNNNLAEKRHINYALFLDRVLRSNSQCPHHRAAHKLLRARKWRELIDYAGSLVKQQYLTAEEHYSANQLAQLIRKYPHPIQTDSLKQERGLAKFLRAEHKCARMNKKMALLDTLRSPEAHALQKMRDFIRYTIGDRPDHQKISELADFGPGTSVGITGNQTSNARKILADHWTATPGASTYAPFYLWNDPHVREAVMLDKGRTAYSTDFYQFSDRVRERLELVDYNKISFVEKDCDEYRTIAVEPLINGYIQKGTDEYFKLCLKRIGIHLDDQSRNQKLAELGSLGISVDPFVTIDLSSASDSICIGLCRSLLPPDWFYFLDQIRSRNYLLRRKTYRYSKFVSMGNGSCFPLESLIFSAICKVACDEHPSELNEFSVYGDDIIVRQSVSHRVLYLLDYLGFKPNPKKTFVSGPFRESCGADFFLGIDVRPVSLDYALDSVTSIYKLCNLFRKIGRESYLGEAQRFLSNLIPTELRFVRPYTGQVDTALEVELDSFLSSPFCHFDRNTRSWGWTEFLIRGTKDPSVHRHDRFPAVLMRAAVRGATSRLPFALRRETTTTIRRIAYAGASSTWLPYDSSRCDEDYVTYE